MIEILKPPKKETVTCNSCKAVLQYEMSDTRRQLVGGGPRVRLHAYFIDCPCCNSPVRVSE